MKGGSERAEADPVIDLWRERSGGWAWGYREGNDQALLRSNENYDRRDEALDSARRAYPGVPIQEKTAPGLPRGSLVGIALVVMVVVALPVLVVAGLILAIRLAMRVGRVRRWFGRLLPSS